MKVLVIPDPHLKIEVIERGLELAKKYFADRVVILGDYFDDWEAVPEQYTRMIKYLKDMLRVNSNVITLLGNHELSYLTNTHSGGFRPDVKDEVEKAIRLDYRFWTCYAVDGVLYSHAGVTDQWLRKHKILTENDIRYKIGKKAGAEVICNGIADKEDQDRVNWDMFNEVGKARGGKDIPPSPLWADLTELIADPIKNVKQVVGHTPVESIQVIGNCCFVDVFSNYNVSDEYLLVKDGDFQIVHYE